jgi:hypothetical protein
MGRRRKQGNTVPQKADNNSIDHLLKGEGNEFPVADPSRMIIGMFNELKEVFKEEPKKDLKEDLKENIQKQLKRISREHIQTSDTETIK